MGWPPRRPGNSHRAFLVGRGSEVEPVFEVLLEEPGEGFGHRCWP